MKKFLVLSMLISYFAISRASELSALPVENRFLFVIENSLAMGRSAKAVEKTLRELIESGVQGQMVPGDSFGLWTFHEQLDTSFELQRWVPSERGKLADTAIDFLKKRRYAKTTAMQSVLPPLFSVVKESRAITVIFISAGNEPISGTPFDGEINRVYANYSRQLHNAKLPFVTVLVGRNGQLVTHAVNSALGPFQIPKRPIEPEPIVVKVKTNALVAMVKPISVTNQPPPKRYAKENIIITGSAPKNQPVPTVAIATTNVPIVTNESVVIPVEKIVAPPSKVLEIPPLTNPVPNPVILPSIVESTQALAVTETEKAAVRFENPATFKPNAEMEIQVGENIPKPRFKRREDGSINTAPMAPAKIPAVVATQPIGNRKNFTLIGLALLVIAGILIAFFIRSARGKSQPSFISRSMNERK